MRPPIHGVVELAAGMITMAAPVVLGFHAAGLVAGLALGSVLIGMSLSLTGSRVLRISAHRDSDNLFGLATAATAVLLAITGDAPATIFFAALAVIHIGLSAITRYVSAA
jgi:hypothetical protein